MNILHITNLPTLHTNLKSIPHHTITETTLPKVRKAVQKFDFAEYDKVLLTGAKVIQVALELAGIYGKDNKASEGTFSTHNYHGFWFKIGSCWCMATYGETDSITLSYQNLDIQRFSGKPSLPAIDVDIIPHIATKQVDIVLDIETTGLDYRNEGITSIQVYYPSLNTVSYIDTNIPIIIEQLYDYIAHSKCKVIGHNLMFDLCFLSNAIGKSFFDFDIVDTMLLSKARGCHHNSLKHLATQHSKYHPNAYKVNGAYNKEYAIVDTLCTYDIYQHYTSKPLRPIDHLTMKSLQVFGNAKLSGIYVDMSKLDAVYSELQQEIAVLEQTLNQYAPIEWGNNNQVSEALQRNGIRLNTKTATGKYSVSVQALEPLKERYTVVDTLLQYRTLTKLLGTFYSTYKDTLDIEHPYLHPEVKVLGTDTGRTSCVKPNIQQVPKTVKRIFTSRYDGGSIAQFDLAQSELRCAVWLSGDTLFAEALQQDAHKVTASKAFGVPMEEVTDTQRKAAKAVNFAALYGATSASNLAQRTGAEESAIQACFDVLQTAYPQLIQWQQKQVAIALRHIRGMDTYKKVRDYRYSYQYGGRGKVRREAMNTPVQAISAYICLELCCYIAERLKEYKSMLIMQIHDSVFIDTHPSEVDIVTKICKEAFLHLNSIPQLNTLPGWGLIPCGGELTFNQSMYDESEDIIALSSEGSK